MSNNIRREFNILLPVIEPSQVESIAPVALALLQGQAGKVIVLGVVEMLPEQSLSEGALPARELRMGLEKITADLDDPRLEVQATVRVSHRPWPEIAQTIVEEGCHWAFLPWSGETEPTTLLFGVSLEEVLENPPCHLALLKWQELAPCRRILMPIRGGFYAIPTIQMALALAELWKANITLLHATPESDWSEPFEHLLDLLPRWRERSRIVRHVAVASEAVESIVEEAQSHQLLVMGASLLPHDSLGPTVQRVLESVAMPTVIVRASEAALVADSPPQAPWMPLLFSTAAISVSKLVDKWFAENSFHSHEFADLNLLLELKREHDVTISLGLPTLNEEATIGQIIETVRGELMDRYPLLDEIVVIDSQSTDRTVEIARSLGVPIYDQHDILSPYGSYRGKGEALWKSLYVLKGDIIVWIDTDIVNIHPGFVYGLVGPLLKQPELQYVKAFYHRPIIVDGQLRASGGGRVTELTARPLINLFYPELSGLVQPLSGEYAGRREALENVPFFTGYGVEIGLLIDILERYGIQAIGQVDLEKRAHRNQPLASLGRMAFAIMQVVIKRLENDRKLHLLEEINRNMKLIRYNAEHLSLQVAEIGDEERPPMIDIPEYRRLRGLEGD